MPPAARITDMHACPLVTPGTPPVPHVGGPVVAGAPTVLVAGMPQARVGDTCTCVGPPDAIAMGSPTVLICGMPAARMGDPTVHGGTVASGAPNVLIGGAGSGGAGASGPALVTPAMVGEPERGNGPLPVCSPPERTLSEERANRDLLFLKFTPKPSTDEGVWGGGADIFAGLARRRIFDREHESWFGGKLDVELGTVESKLYFGLTDNGFGGSAKSEAQVGKIEFSGTLGKDPNNAFVETQVTGKVLSGSHKVAYLNGDNGREQGHEFSKKLEWAGVKVEEKTEINIKWPLKRPSYKIPFWDAEIPNPFFTKSISIAFKSDVAVGDGALGGGYNAKRNEHGIYQAGLEAYVGAGLGGQVHVGQSKETGRGHIGAKFGVKSLLGFNFAFDLSYGDQHTSEKRHDIID